MGNVSADVVSGSAIAVDQAPRASWLPTTKTASPGLERMLSLRDELIL